MSEYQPGTVAVATVRGVEGVRVMRTSGTRGADIIWLSAEIVGGARYHSERDVTDIRPLVVLDLGLVDGRELARVVRYEYDDWAFLADQIEAQTKPPRIPEPGLYGVVSTDDAEGLTTYRWRSHDGWHGEDGSIHEWADLIDPILIREGVESDA